MSVLKGGRALALLFDWLLLLCLCGRKAGGWQPLNTTKRERRVLHFFMLTTVPRQVFLRVPKKESGCRRVTLCKNSTKSLFACLPRSYPCCSFDLLFDPSTTLGLLLFLLRCWCFACRGLIFFVCTQTHARTHAKDLLACLCERGRTRCAAPASQPAATTLLFLVHVRWHTSSSSSTDPHIFLFFWGFFAFCAWHSNKVGLCQQRQPFYRFTLRGSLFSLPSVCVYV